GPTDMSAYASALRTPTLRELAMSWNSCWISQDLLEAPSLTILRKGWEGQQLIKQLLKLSTEL
ncbi:hypothetical protein STEG23_019549, partial [Scotinomys teguina]